jgi:uncharacterized protein (DUF2062 family)
VFKRRKSRSRLQHLKEAVWPSAGWIRALTYWGHRLIRLKGTPHSIALGLAFGAAVSMTPFVGLHLVLTLLLCWIFGGQGLAGAIGTFVGNPWTFPFIWVFTYRLGSAILGMEAGMHPTIELSLGDLLNSPFDTIAPMIGPMIVGSIPCAIAAWWLMYLPSKYLITGHRRRRAERLAAREKRSIMGGGAHQG